MYARPAALTAILGRVMVKNCQHYCPLHWKKPGGPAAAGKDAQIRGFGRGEGEGEWGTGLAKNDRHETQSCAPLNMI
jgi:hypothetical protein